MKISNVEFRVGDAAEFTWPAPGSTHLVFINWLLMYLKDQEAKAVLQRAVAALATEGCLFVHESADDATPPEILTYEPYSAEYPAR